MKRPEQRTQVYTDTDGGGTYSIILTTVQCRMIEHRREDDHVVDSFDIGTALEWAAVFGMLEDMSSSMMGPTFNAAERVISGHETRAKP